MPSPAFRHALLLVAAVVANAAPARAGWQPDGVPVCLHPLTQYSPVIASDGSGGAYIVWSDSRDYGTTNLDLYLQHLTAGGDLAPGWPASGLPLCTAPGPQFFGGSMISDGEGGVLAAWWDRRSGTQDDIYVQRIGPSESPMPGWPVDGVQVTNLPTWETSPSLASDGAGGAFIAWRDERDRDATNLADIYCSRLLADGMRAPGWPENGLPVSTGPLSEGDPHLLPDGSGGVFIAWGYGDQSAADIRAIRLTATGEVAPGWIAGGTVMCSAPGARGLRGLVIDGAGGGYLAWDDYRTAPPGTQPSDLEPYSDIYAQRFTGTGDLAPGWPADGLPLCTLPFIQNAVTLATDGFGGCIVAWQDFRDYFVPEYIDIYALRVMGDGALAPGWTAQGTRVSAGFGTQYAPRVVADGTGGAYLLYSEIEDYVRLEAQHLTGSGQLAPSWPEEGVRLVQVPGSEQYHEAISDGRGGAIVVWEDGRAPGTTGNIEIYAQRIGADGPTPVLVSLVSAEAEVGAVRLTWYAGGEASLVATVERRTETSEWERLGSITPDGTGTLTYEDRSVTPATRYAYRLSYRDGGEIAYTAEVWVTVPAPRFALRGLTPNPSEGDPVVAFSLATADPAALELYDLSGRLVYSHEVGSRGPGTHSSRLEGRGHLPAGVYNVVLRQGTRVATTRAVVIR
jgi:hypothetical protein